jgi:hypothetical protein
MLVSEALTLKSGDKVREASYRVPRGCTPFIAVVESVSADGWVQFSMLRPDGSKGLGRSYPPRDLERF